MENLEHLLEESLKDGYLSREESERFKRFLEQSRPGADRPIQYLDQAIKLATQAVEHHDPQAVMKWLKKVSQLMANSDASSNYNAAFFAHHDDIRRHTVQFLHEAKSTLDICMFTLTDNVVAEAVTEMFRNGVKTRIITDDQKIMDPGSDIFKLKSRGIDIKIDSEDSLMHHKFTIIDGQRVLTGSYNWTRTGAEVNNENFIVLDNDGIVHAFIKEFERLWEEMTPL